MSFWEWIASAVISAFLIWSAVADMKERKIPYIPGWGLLAIGAVYTWMTESWLPALFLISIIIGSMGPWLRLLPTALGITVLFNDMALLPFVAGVMLCWMLFELKWLGGGDTQIALGLLGIGVHGGWWMTFYLFATTAIIGIFVILWTRGAKGGVKRALEIAGNLSGSANDPQAIKVPWAVIAALAGLTYIWFVPGGGVTW
jgi:Flp pilus assembly protein protease CpaA